MHQLKLIIFSGLILFSAGLSAQVIDLDLPIPDPDTDLILYASEVPQLQNTIDLITAKIFLKTKIGKALALNLFDCQPTQLEDHLGISSAQARKLGLSCDYSRDEKPSHAFVHESFKPDITKTSLLPDSDKRSYVIIVTNSNKWNINSWTHPFSNETYLVVRLTDDVNELNTDFLTALIAHELAVYFDAKIALDSPEWSIINSSKNLTIESESLLTALSHPLIASSLSAMRAFRVEQEIINDLILAAFISPEMNAPYSHMDFLGSECTDECRRHTLKRFTESLWPLNDLLLYYSPWYRQRMLKQVGQLPFPARNSINEILNESLTKNIGFHGYASNFSMVFPLKRAFESKQIQAPAAQRWLFTKASERLLKVDPETIQALMSPLLSGLNIRGAFGPRPRIRVGHVR